MPENFFPTLENIFPTLEKKFSRLEKIFSRQGKIVSGLEFFLARQEFFLAGHARMFSRHEFFATPVPVRTGRRVIWPGGYQLCAELLAPATP